MGSLGVSSFQQVYGALLADAVGPRFAYWDEWPMAAKLLRPGIQHSPEVAEAILKEAESGGTTAIVMKPQLQVRRDCLPLRPSAAACCPIAPKLTRAPRAHRSAAGSRRRNDIIRTSWPRRRGT